MPGHRIRVVAPDVGGGFGGKGSLYPEEILVAVLARHLGRAVRWTGDRLEDLMSTSQAFDEIVDAELGARRRRPYPRARRRGHRRCRGLFDLPVDRRARTGAGRQLPARPLPGAGLSRADARRSPPTRRRWAPIAASAGRSRPSSWSGSSTWRRGVWRSIRSNCACATWSAPTNSPTARRPASSGTARASSKP